MDLAELRNEVFRLRPLFGAFYHEWGEKTWPEYYRFVYESLTKRGITPKPTIIKAIQDELTHIFGDISLGKHTAQIIREKGWVSTVDHHGVLCHPYFYASNLALTDESVCGSGKVHMTLTFGNISLGNDSFPRGFFFHDPNGKEVRVHFVSGEHRMLPVYCTRAMTKAQLMRERDRVLMEYLPKSARKRLASFFDRILQTQEIWSTSEYGIQLSLINRILWQMLFGEDRGELLYVQIDAIVHRLLLEKYLCVDGALHELFGNPMWQDAYVRHFEGIQSAHGRDHGTELFWYIDQERGTRRRMMLREGFLQTLDGDVTIQVTRDAIGDALRSHTIMPCTALILIIVHAEELLTCGGGVSQPMYLNEMLDAWNRVRVEGGYEPIQSGDTSILSGEYTLFQNESAKGVSVLSSLMDVYLYEDSPSTLVDTALSALRVANTIDAMIPTLNTLLTRNHKSMDISTLPLHTIRTIT